MLSYHGVRGDTSTTDAIKIQRRRTWNPGPSPIAEEEGELGERRSRDGDSTAPSMESASDRAVDDNDVPKSFESLETTDDSPGAPAPPDDIKFVRCITKESLTRSTTVHRTDAPRESTTQPGENTVMHLSSFFDAFAGTHLPEEEPEQVIADELFLDTGVKVIPHPEKGDGADSYFCTPNALGCADGVGEWEWRFRICPRAFADALMFGSRDNLAQGKTCLEALTIAHANAEAFGSATALVTSLEKDILHICNLGDSGLAIFRDNTSIYKTKEMQHSFNCPYQLAKLPSEKDFPRLLAEGKHVLVNACSRRGANADEKLDMPHHSKVENKLTTMIEIT